MNKETLISDLEDSRNWSIDGPTFIFKNPEGEAEYFYDNISTDKFGFRKLTLVKDKHIIQLKMIHKMKLHKLILAKMAVLETRNEYARMKEKIDSYTHDKYTIPKRSRFQEAMDRAETSRQLRIHSGVGNRTDRDFEREINEMQKRINQTEEKLNGLKKRNKLTTKDIIVKASPFGFVNNIKDILDID